MSTDLRVIKTERSIHDAFVRLRMQKPVERITVRELCEEAMINKATFYLHYKDIFELSETLENEFIEDCLMNISDENICSVDVDKVVIDLTRAFSAKDELFHILFDGSGVDRIAEKVDDFTRKRLFVTFPELKDNLAFNIDLTAAIYGGFHAFFTYKGDRRDVPARNKVIASVANFVKRSLNR